jgi:hypothetical protein
VIENTVFYAALKKPWPGLCTLHTKKLSKRMSQYVDAFEEWLLNNLPKEAILLVTLDIWESSQKQSVLGIVGNFIDKS